MTNTTYIDVLRSFESSFQDKFDLPTPLIYEWFKRAVGYYSLEVSELNFDYDSNEFDTSLPRYVVDALALLMKWRYQERELSRVNKMNNIIGRDVAFNSTGDAKKATKAELDEIKAYIDEVLHKIKTNSF
jgi:hypothetical protein